MLFRSSLDQMPLTMARGWRNFVNAFVPEPQCCPARASLLTGRLPSRTGVDTLDRGNRGKVRRSLMSQGRRNRQLPRVPQALLDVLWRVVKHMPSGYWEQEFAQLKPVKRRGNRRYYQHHEVLLIRRIRELLYEQGFTISGARNKLDSRVTSDLDTANTAAAVGADLAAVRVELTNILGLLRI